jgi:hypothetical protein
VQGVTTFREVLRGRLRWREGRPRVEPVLLELALAVPGPLWPWSDVEATARGTVRSPRLGERAVAGTVRIAPLAARRIRYRLDLDGEEPLHLDGWKSLSLWSPVWTMTHLPAAVVDGAGAVVAEARLRFVVHRDLARFLVSFRYSRTVPTGVREARSS